jgi:hypothetical protein
MLNPMSTQNSHFVKGVMDIISSPSFNNFDDFKYALNNEGYLISYPGDKDSLHLSEQTIMFSNQSNQDLCLQVFLKVGPKDQQNEQYIEFENVLRESKISPLAKVQLTTGRTLRFVTDFTITVHCTVKTKKRGSTDTNSTYGVSTCNDYLSSSSISPIVLQGGTGLFLIGNPSGKCGGYQFIPANGQVAQGVIGCALSDNLRIDDDTEFVLCFVLNGGTDSCVPPVILDKTNRNYEFKHQYTFNILLDRKSQTTDGDFNSINGDKTGTNVIKPFTWNSQISLHSGQIAFAFNEESQQQNNNIQISRGSITSFDKYYNYLENDKT